MPGSIIPTGVITSKDGSFNSVIRFYDTKNAKQQHLFANGVRLSGVTPHMVLKNTSDAPIVAQPTVFSVGVSTREPILLPAVNLAANEARELDLGGIGQKQGFDVVSLMVTSSGGPGGLIGSIHGIQDKTGLSYDTPLRDTGPVRAMTGSYPWKIANDFTTIVYITNVTDQEAEFMGEINYHGGRVIVEPRKLQPGETATFDMRQIRADGITDSNGGHVPRTATVGQFKWSVRGVTNGKHLLIGRAEMVSLSHHISTSYSCNDPCPPYYEGSIDPSPPPVLSIGGSQNLTVKETAWYDSGYHSTYTSYGDWSMTSSIGWLSPTLASTTSMNGTAAGEGWVSSFIGIQQDYGWDGLNCYEYGTYEEWGSAPAEVQCQIPTGETSEPDVWGTGTLATVHMWKQTLTGPGNFVDRLISELEGNPATISDSCHFEGSEIAKYKISGLDATVTAGNKWKPDAVGFPTGAVTYYRNQGRAPCSATASQVMYINCPEISTQYATGNLVVGITATEVSSKRHSAATQTKTWP